MKQLLNVPFVKSPNRGGSLVRKAVKYIVVHYTASDNFKSTQEWLCSPRAKASAHVLIGRDGEIVQLVSLDSVAWHAGESAWKGLTGLNKYSIGIELVNLGPLVELKGKLTGATTGRPVEKADAHYGPHKNGGSYLWWQKYTGVQIAALERVCAELCGMFPIEEIVGHDDVAPHRKQDVGPAGTEFMVDLNQKFFASVPKATP